MSDKPLPSVKTINDVKLKANPRCSASQYACLLAVLQKKQDRMAPKDLCTFLSLFGVPNAGSSAPQPKLAQLAEQVRKVLKNEAKEQQSWGLACQTFVNGDKNVKDALATVDTKPAAAAAAARAHAPAPAPAPAPEPEPEPELEVVAEAEAAPEPEVVAEAEAAPEPEEEPAPAEPAEPEEPVEEKADDDVVPEPEPEPEVEPEEDPFVAEAPAGPASSTGGESSDPTSGMSATERAAYWQKQSELSKGEDAKAAVVSDYKPKKRQTSFKVKKTQEGVAKQMDVDAAGVAPKGPSRQVGKVEQKQKAYLEHAETVARESSKITSQTVGRASTDVGKVNSRVDVFKQAVEVTEGTRTSSAGRPKQIEIPRGPEVVYEAKPEDDIDSDDGGGDVANAPAGDVEAEAEAEPAPPAGIVIAARASDGRPDDMQWNRLGSAGEEADPRLDSLKSQFEQRTKQRDAELAVFKKKIESSKKGRAPKPAGFVLRPQLVLESAFNAIEVGCKDLQAKAKKLGKTPVAVTVARGAFDDLFYVYAHQYSNELIANIERARAGSKAPATIETSLLDETYQAVHAAAAGMKAELSKAAS